MVKKKLLFMEDLLKVFQTNGLTKFSSADFGYKLCVQVPATFEVENTVDDAHRGMMRLKVRVFHTLLNRNGSYITKEAAEDAMPTIKNRPLLAYIHKRDDGEWDFWAHNVSVETDEDGNEYYEYEEKQIGNFDESDPFFEYDEALDKTYICAYAYISEDYTRACDIIRRKGGTKNSVELCIEELSYSAKEKYLNLEKFYISASTLLGSEPDGTEVMEGMEGSRADIFDFSEKNNSVLSNDLVDKIANAVVERLNNKAGFSAKNLEEGGWSNLKFKELLEKYGKKAEDIEFDYKNMTDEELEAKFAEVFDNSNNDEEGASSEDSSGEDSAEIKPEENDAAIVDTEFDDDNGGNDGDNTGVNDNDGGTSGDNSQAEETTEEDEHQSVSAIEDEDSSTAKKFVKSYEVSHEDIRYGLYVLLQQYEENDGEWYFISNVYDNHFVYENWGGTVIYDQKYSKENDNVKFEGERIHMNKELLTDSELVALNNMRSNYSAIESELNSYKSKELNSLKEETLEKYSEELKDYEPFKELVKNKGNYTLDELTVQAKCVYADFKQSEEKVHEEVQSPKKMAYGMLFMSGISTDKNNTDDKKLPYGGLFKDFNK